MLEIQKKNKKLKEELAILKKGFIHIRGKIYSQSIDSFISEHKDKSNIKTMCKIFRLPRSTYYDRIKRKPSKRSLENKKFEELIMNIYLESKKRYGAPKITAKLNKLGHKISIKRVQRLMRELEIRSIVKKKYRHYKSSDSDFKRGDNLLNRDFSATDINEKWVTDITYIHTLKDGWCYLASVMDTKITIETLNKAYRNQKPLNELIIHSDRGTQYISKMFRNKVKESGLVQSFSSKDNPYDNAAMKSFHAIRKKKKKCITESIEILKKLLYPYLSLLKAGITETEYTAVLII